MTEANLNIQHDPSSHKFFAVVAGRECLMEYRVFDETTLDYFRTFVPLELRGHQLGDKIVEFALDYAKNYNLKVIPTCPFVAKIVAQHPEYNSIIL